VYCPLEMKPSFDDDDDIVLEPRAAMGKRARRTQKRLENLGLDEVILDAPYKPQPTVNRSAVHERKLQAVERALIALPGHIADIIMDKADVLRPKVLFVRA
jgi:hypothetical protein